MLIAEFTKIANSLTINMQPNQIKFVYASEFQANLEADDIAESDFPFIVYETAITTTGTFTGAGRIQASAPLKFMFLDLDDLDSDGLESDEIVKRMRSLANQFVLKIQNSDLLIPGMDITTFTLSNIFKAFDAAASGVLLEITIPLNEDVNYCV